MLFFRTFGLCMSFVVRKFMIARWTSQIINVRLILIRLEGVVDLVRLVGERKMWVYNVYF